MPTHIALLRAVNVGGARKLPMAELKAMLVKLGFADAKTLLQSGNVVFTDARKPAALEKLLETETAKAFKLTTDYFVRTAKEWEAIVAANPFPREAENDSGRLVVVALKDAPKDEAVKALQAAIKGREIVRGGARHLYIYYPDGQGESKLTIAVIKKHLGTRGTARNWNTVMKLKALVA